MNQEIRVRTSLEVTFAALLEQLNPSNERPDGTPMPMKLEAWPGGRWFRDLGEGNGHFWGSVQAIKRPTLLEISGPLFMSYPVANNVQYRLSEEGGGTLIQFRHSSFETQAPITRKFLEWLPQDKLPWKPHEKSLSAGQLAYHLAFVPGGAVPFVQNNPAQAPDFANFPEPASREEILKAFEESRATVRSLLPKFEDAAMRETWRLVAGGREVLVQQRAEFLRDVMLSHWYQHRGQFSVCPWSGSATTTATTITISLKCLNRLSSQKQTLPMTAAPAIADGPGWFVAAKATVA